MAKVHAGAIHLMYGFLNYVADQLFAARADTEGLEAIGDEYGITRNSATAATGSGAATGTNGTVIPAGSELQSTSGQVYETDSAATIATGTATLDFTAQEAGEDGNDDGGISLSFVSPIVGIDNTVTVDSDGIQGGTDEETDENLRDRILSRKRKPPHGGAEFDYETWAKEVSGVTRVWTFPQYQGNGTIGVAFTRDNDTSIIPNQVQRQTVYDYIVEHSDPGTGKTVGIPVTAEPGFFVIEIEQLAVNIEIDISPNTATVQSNVRGQLEDYIFREGGPGNTLYLSKISEAISLAVGEERHELVSPVADVSAATNQVHVLGTVTFNTLA
jgi:uncharacterized phage protein gp47/JayE